MLDVPDRILRRLSRHSFATARVRYRLGLRDPVAGNPVIVHTMGKVGSTSVVAALREAIPDRTLHHVHWLASENLAADEALYRRRASDYRGTPRALRFHPRYVWLGQRLGEAISRGRGAPWDVVTLVRDPVARNVSSFFQNLELLHDIWLGEEPPPNPDTTAARLVDLFMESYVGRGPAYGLDGDPLTWFDIEMAPVFGVDVYASPFPIERGFGLYRSDKARVLLLRLESLPEAAAPGLEELLGRPGIAVPRLNDATAKAYADVYAAFKERLRLPPEYLDRMYQHRFTRHFYAPDERAAFRARWSGSTRG